MGASRAALGRSAEVERPARSAAPLLTKEQEQHLAKRMEAGDRSARQRFFDCNQRLVYSVARCYAGCGVPLLDLVQEGNLGLLQAIDHFDWRRDRRFSTYATLWIRQAVSRAVYQLGLTIHVPSRVARLALQREAQIEHLAQELLRAPTQDEVEHMCSDPNGAGDIVPLPLEPLSLDGVHHPDERSRDLTDQVGDQADGPERRLLQSMATAALLDQINQLAERERRVLVLRYGLRGEREHTLVEIGLAMGLTRQRIKQIECLALRKLRKRLADSPETADLIRQCC